MGRTASSLSSSRAASQRRGEGGAVGRWPDAFDVWEELMRMSCRRSAMGAKRRTPEILARDSMLALRLRDGVDPEGW
jgi:hypothetical protein